MLLALADHMNANEDAASTELTQRLAEAEATIAALLSGQIDAVVDARTRRRFCWPKRRMLYVSSATGRSVILNAPEIILLAVGLDGEDYAR